MLEAILGVLVIGLLLLVGWKDVRHTAEGKRHGEALEAAEERAAREVHRALTSLIGERRYFDEERENWDIERGRYVAALLARDGDIAAAQAVRAPAASRYRQPADAVVGIDL
jgi:hypothetical protein